MHSTRERIRDVAVRLFAARGFAATGIREIAQAADLSSSVLYHYYATKEDLLVEIMQIGTHLLLETAKAALEGVKDPAACLATLTQVHVAIQARDPRSASVVDGEVRALKGEARAEIIALRDQYEGLWKETLERGREEGIFHIEDTQLARLALLEMCNGIAYWYSPTGPQPLEAIILVFSDLVLGAVGARRGNQALRTADLPLAAPSSSIVQVEQAYRQLYSENGEGKRAPV